MPEDNNNNNNNETAGDEQQQQQRASRYWWILVERSGHVRLVASTATYEMRQLTSLLGGAVTQSPLGKLTEHRLGFAWRSLVETDETVNHAFSSFAGITITGDVVVGARRDSDSGLFGRARRGYRYILPMLTDEAKQVRAKIESALGGAK